MTHYTHLHALMASPTEPMPEPKRRHQLTKMWHGLASLESADQPGPDDWRVCSDAVNLLETLVIMGEVKDPSGLLPDAVAALARAGQRHLAGGPLRLDGLGIQAVRAVLEDYASAIEVLSHRTMVMAHRRTEKRISELLKGRGRAGDVVMVEV